MPANACSDYTSNTGTSFYDGGITSTLINTPAGDAPKAGPARPALPRLP